MTTQSTETAERVEVCGICGKPATGWFNNLREIQPVSDSDGVLWTCWEIKDGPHHRCDEHENWGSEPPERLSKKKVRR